MLIFNCIQCGYYDQAAGYQNSKWSEDWISYRDQYSRHIHRLIQWMNFHASGDQVTACLLGCLPHFLSLIFVPISAVLNLVVFSKGFSRSFQICNQLQLMLFYLFIFNMSLISIQVQKLFQLIIIMLLFSTPAKFSHFSLKIK